MKKTLLMLLAAAFAAFSVSAAETKASAEKTAAEKAAKPAAKKAVKKAAKPKRKPYVIPADGGLQIATTPKARNNPNAKRKSTWHKRYDAKLKQIADYKNDVDVVFIGDSITHFWDNDGAKNKRKIGGLATYKKYFSNYKVINLVCGGLLVYLHKTKKYPPLTQAEAPAEEEKEEN